MVCNEICLLLIINGQIIQHFFYSLYQNKYIGIYAEFSKYLKQIMMMQWNIFNTVIWIPLTFFFSILIKSHREYDDAKHKYIHILIEFLIEQGMIVLVFLFCMKHPIYLKQIWKCYYLEDQSNKSTTFIIIQNIDTRLCII